MTVAQLEKRVAALEKALDELRAKVEDSPVEPRHWWRDDAGRFANDPLFDEMTRLGKEYRESLNPYRKKKKKKNARS